MLFMYIMPETDAGKYLFKHVCAAAMNGLAPNRVIQGTHKDFD